MVQYIKVQFTYTASKPVEVVILENFSNESAVDPAYGSIATAPLGEGTVAISLLTPQYNSPINAASLPFAGNALALHTLNGDPFAATYTVTGDVEKPQTFNLVNPPPVAEATQADAGDGDGQDGGKTAKTAVMTAKTAVMTAKTAVMTAKTAVMTAKTAVMTAKTAVMTAVMTATVMKRITE